MNVNEIIKKAKEKIQFENAELQHRQTKGYPKHIQNLIPEDLRPRAYNEITPHLVDIRRVQRYQSMVLKDAEDNLKRIKDRISELISIEESLTDLQNIYLPPYGIHDEQTIQKTSTTNTGIGNNDGDQRSNEGAGDCKDEVVESGTATVPG